MPRNFRNFSKDIHSLGNGKKPSVKAVQQKISTNSQDSSSSSLKSLEVNTYRMKESPVENCGNVEKKGPAFFNRAGCRRQVYSSLAVAEGMTVSLRSLGIAAQVERCGLCNLIHVLELPA
jgi:hypothetical protein